MNTALVILSRHPDPPDPRESIARLPIPDASMKEHPEGEDPEFREQASQLVNDLIADVPGAAERFYALFSKGIRFFLCRHLGPQDIEDRVHDSFVVLLQAIRSGEIREPDRLQGFVRTILRRQVASYVGTEIQRRRESSTSESESPAVDSQGNPEVSAIRREKIDLVLKTLGRLSDRDREVLTRFYLHEESQEAICAAMQLTETQFRLLKSRAKQRFGEIGKRDLMRDSFWKRYGR
jgi:RNA polymerase sigma factor (sigma-70 family)